MRGPGLREAGEDDGFGLVEVIVSMVLLAIIALAFLPLVARATQAAAAGSQVATASRLVSTQMELIRAAPPTTCPVAGPEPLGVSAGSPVDGPRGVKLQTWTKFGSGCAQGQAVRYVVSVTVAGRPTEVLASASTLVVVGAP